MTALMMDGFDHYGTGISGCANMLDGVWADMTTDSGGQGFTLGTPSWGAARTGTTCLVLNTINLSSLARIVVPGAPAKMYVSFGYAINSLPSGATFLFDTRDAGNVVKHSVQVNSTGSISLYSGQAGNGGTLLATTSGPVIRARTWHFIEMCIDYTAGNFAIRVDDASASASPAITHAIATGLANAQIGFFCFSFQNLPQQCWDDLFIRNSSGSVNNDWLGDRRVATLFANADTTTAGWTPRYYQKFGSGVLRVSHMDTNSSGPTSPNAVVTAASASALSVGSADFTLESFVRFEALPGAAAYSTIFSRWDAANNARSYRLVLGGSSFNNSALQFDYTTDGTSSTITTPIVYPFAPDLNRWYHVALVRASNELLLFVDGAQLGLPIPITATLFGGGPFALGAEAGTGGVVASTNLIGMYDETRFTNGVARYTTSFAPPTDPFPRGSLLDPSWSSVVLLSGFNTAIQDESSYLRTLSAAGGAVQFAVNDGVAVGAFSTISKVTPDDNTFISAAFTSATGILTMTTQPSAGNTVTVGTKEGTTPAVYTFRTSLASAYDVLIDTTAQNTLLNLVSAINATAGAGTKYGTGTLANFDVTASQLPAGQIMVTANTAGTAGNAIPTTESGSATSWGASTLTGGANIPGPSDFKVQRPPPNTTIISAIQATIRAYKSDAGTCTVRNSLIGPLGGVLTGSAHNLAINPGYYLDVLETDPDTSGPITPATLINGKLRINRTA